MSKDVEILKQLIKEVKEEMKSGVLKENKEPKTKKETLNEFVIKNVMEHIRESGG